MDGATEWQLYTRIILPLLSPITLTAMIILGHISLKVFDLIVAVAGKQLPLDVPAIYMWTTTFDGGFYNRGAAIGILLLLSVAVLVIPYTAVFHPEIGGVRMKTRTRYWLYIPLLMMTIFYLLPMYIMLNTGFKSFAEVSLKTMWNLPSGLHFDNFIGPTRRCRQICGTVCDWWCRRPSSRPFWAPLMALCWPSGNSKGPMSSSP